VELLSPLVINPKTWNILIGLSQQASNEKEVGMFPMPLLSTLSAGNLKWSFMVWVAIMKECGLHQCVQQEYPTWRSTHAGEATASDASICAVPVLKCRFHWFGLWSGGALPEDSGCGCLLTQAKKIEAVDYVVPIWSFKFELISLRTIFKWIPLNGRICTFDKRIALKVI
jgi:hypothetical protein